MTLLPAQNTFWLSQEKSTGIVSAHRKWTRGTICSFCSLSQSQWASFEKIENRSTRTWSNENSNYPTATIECCRIATPCEIICFPTLQPKSITALSSKSMAPDPSSTVTPIACSNVITFLFLKMVSPAHDLFLNISSRNVKAFTLFHNPFWDAQVWRICTARYTPSCQVWPLDVSIAVSSALQAAKLVFNSGVWKGHTWLKAPFSSLAVYFLVLYISVATDCLLSQPLTVWISLAYNISKMTGSQMFTTHLSGLICKHVSPVRDAPRRLIQRGSCMKHLEQRTERSCENVVIGIYHLQIHVI